MRIVILGDFSGRGSREESDVAQLAKRRFINVDRDNFDEVFSSLKVKLRLPVSDEELAFSEFEDLHPDYLYQRISLFDKMRTLGRKLKKPEHFDEAAAEIQQWASYQAQRPQPQESATPAAGIELPTDMLDAVLNQSSAQQLWDDSPAGQIDKLIKDIVAPYVEDKSDPRLPELEAALQQAMAQTLRRICHARAFQQLEASWRSLNLLVRRLETNSRLTLELLDVSKEELLQDLQQCGEELNSAAMYKRLVDSQAVVNGKRPSLLLADFVIADKVEDIALMSALAQCAEALGAALLCGGSTRLAGCESLAATDDPDDWHFEANGEVLSALEVVKESSAGAHVAMLAPGYMLRLPYGKRTSPIESFPYEELGDGIEHKFYLWGNGAWLAALLLGQCYSELGWDFRPGQLQCVEDLPLHAYTDEDGDAVLKPCAEVLLTDRAAGVLQKAGLTPLRSVSGRDEVLLPEFLAINAEILQGPWR